MNCSRLGRLPHPFLLSAICSACCLSVLASPSCAQEPAKGSSKSRAKIEFVTQIEPVFAQHCLKCHGAKDSQSGLRLDSLAAILKGGDRGLAVVPGEAAKSLLVKALQGEGDPTPMPAEAPRLPKETIARVIRWINEGAKGPAESTVGARPTHWAFAPVAHPRVPAMGSVNRAGNPIDAFIRQRLAAERLVPSPDADRSTLIRRLSFDLRGLPPS